MPVDTSVITGTVAHKHSATGGSSDGGKLAVGGLGSDTSFDLSNGSIMYSNGTSLQELAIGSASDTLTVSGGVPTWATGGGTSYEKIASTTLSSDVNNFNVSWSAVSQSTISQILVVLNSKCTAQESPDITVNGISTSTYESDGAYWTGGAMGQSSYSGEAYWRIIRGEINSNGELYSNIYLVCNPVSETISCWAFASSNHGMSMSAGYNSTTSQTTLSEIDFDFDSGAAVWLDGTRCDVYKISV
jgi:hypothetical protein